IFTGSSQKYTGFLKSELCSAQYKTQTGRSTIKTVRARRARARRTPPARLAAAAEFATGLARIRVNYGAHHNAQGGENEMDNNTLTAIVIGIFAVVIIAAILVFRNRVRAEVSGPF